MKNWLLSLLATYKKEFVTRLVDFKGVSNRTEFAVVWLTVTLVWFAAVKTSGLVYYKHMPAVLFMIQGVMSLPILSVVVRRSRSLLPNPTHSTVKMWVLPVLAIFITMLPLISYLMLLLFFFVPMHKSNAIESAQSTPKTPDSQTVTETTHEVV